MTNLAHGVAIQLRVIQALLLRELSTRFGRDNIGFLWIMAEPLLFAVLVGIMWRYMKGPEEHGVSVFAFVVSGYVPLVLFRHSITRSVMLFSVNSALMYHRQIKIHDFILARFLIEWIGHMMAYLAIVAIMLFFDAFPIPADMGLFLIGWFYYSAFTLAVCFVLAPLSEMSEVLEKFMPVVTYMMVPFSGSFAMVSWLTPGARDVMYYSPPVHAMEMMRSGLFGTAITPYYNFVYPMGVTIVLMVIGLALCRKVRRMLVIE